MRREKRGRLNEEIDQGEDDGDYDQYLDFEDVKGQLSAWVEKPNVRKWIRFQFAKFLRQFREDSTGPFIYEQRITDMVTAQK